MGAGELITLIVLYIAMLASVLFIYSFLEKPKLSRKEVPKEWPKVTVAVPVHNGAECLAKTLQHVVKLDYPKDKLQILVIENGKSTDNSFEIAKSFAISKLLSVDLPFSITSICSLSFG